MRICVCVCARVARACMTFLLSPGITGLNTLPIYEIIKLAKLYYYYILLDKNPLTKYWIELYVNESSAISLAISLCRIYSTNKKIINVSKY